MRHQGLFLCLSDKLCSIFSSASSHCLSGTDKDSKHSTDSSNNSVSGESGLQNCPGPEQEDWSFRLGSLIAAAFCHAQRGLVWEQLVQSAARHPPAHSYSPTLLHSYTLCFTICSSTASSSVEIEKRNKKTLHFSASGIFPSPFHMFCLHVKERQVSPTCWKRDMRASSHATFDASERRNHRDESTGAAVTLTRHGSPGEPAPLRAAFLFSSLLFYSPAFLLFTRVCRRRKANVRNKSREGRGERGGGWRVV